MSGYLKLAILAFLVLNASAAMNAQLQSRMKNIGREQLIEAEIKALMEMKEVEAMLMNIPKCLARGESCNPNLIIQECCSKRCGISILPWHKGFVCG